MEAVAVGSVQREACLQKQMEGWGAQAAMQTEGCAVPVEEILAQVVVSVARACQMQVMRGHAQQEEVVVPQKMAVRTSDEAQEWERMSQRQHWGAKEQGHAAIVWEIAWATGPQEVKGEASL